MEKKHSPVDSHRLGSLAEKFRDNKKYRDSYMVANTRRFLAKQMLKFRGDQSQTEFGEKIGKLRTVVARLEDASYGKWTLQTLFDVAQKLDVAVHVRFVDFPTFLELTNDISDRDAKPPAYNQEYFDYWVSSNDGGFMDKIDSVYCDNCETIRPAIFDHLGDKGNGNDFFHPTDIVCGDCKFVIATLFASNE